MWSAEAAEFPGWPLALYSFLLVHPLTKGGTCLSSLQDLLMAKFEPYLFLYEREHQGSLVQYTGMGFGYRWSVQVLPAQPIINPLTTHYLI